MRVLEVSNYFKPSWETGGVTKVNYELSKGLVEKGHEVSVYTTDGYASRLNVPKNKPVYVDGIRVYYFYNLFRSLVKKMKFPTPYYAPFILRKEIKNFDIIHIHEHRTLLAAFVHHYAMKYNVPYVVQAHGSVLPSFQKQTFKHLFDFFFGDRILKNATKLIALNNTEALQYQKMGVNPNKIEILPNGINISEFQDISTKGTFRNKYSISNTCKIILYVGRIHRNKGLDLLVNSYYLVRNKIPESKLIFVGPDNGSQIELEQLCDNLGLIKNVLFTGFVDSDTKVAALLDADVFVTPNFSGFPMTFLEACALGLPIITTECGDDLGWIDGNVGYVVQNDKIHLSESIFKLLTNVDLINTFSNNGINFVSNHFEWNVIIRRLENIYKSLL